MLLNDLYGENEYVYTVLVAGISKEFTSSQVIP